VAVGDVKSGLSSIAAGAYLAIQPSGTEEWVIHNIYHASDAEFHFYDGTNDILVESHYGKGGWLGYFFHVRNGLYIRVKNANTAAKLIGYDGVCTHT